MPSTTLPAPEAHSGRSWLRHFGLLGVLAVGIGVVRAAQLAWISDDAYISFRYARNFVDGLGLVYNAGEPVEGYTNFLWTVWCALGLRLGVSAEAWANATSIACFAATIALLARLSARRTADLGFAAPFPLAALWVALQPDAGVFATSGLETSLFTLLVVAGYAVLVGLGGSADVRRSAVAAAFMGLACLTRPDGVVFAMLGGGYVLLVARPRARAVLAYGAVLAAIGAPFAWWKLAYYGDLLPNTFYAKSAMIPWWDQGWAYAWLYFSKYPPMIVGPVLVLLLAVLGRSRRPASEPGASTAPMSAPGSGAFGPALLATAFALVYTLYVMRVGGDFMFARLLIPATPFYALAAELGLAALAKRLASRRVAVTAFAIPGVLALAAIGLARDPFDDVGWVRGIVNERAYYKVRDRDRMAQEGRDLRELTRGLPVRAAIVCEQAISAYYSEIPVVFEACAGLTDSAIAHQRIEKRGRVGHEKKPSLEYLIEYRRAHFNIGAHPGLDQLLGPHIPVIRLRYRTAMATLLTWDPEIMEEFRRRGAEFEDFSASLDDIIADMPRYSDSTVAGIYARAKRFYFSSVEDPRREAPFLQRLARDGRLAEMDGSTPTIASAESKPDCPCPVSLEPVATSDK